MEKTAQGNPLVERMFKAGAHFGYSRSRRHPTVSPFIFGAKNRVEIFDLERTSETLEAAKDFVRELGSQGKKLVFVGGKPEASHIVKDAALSLNMPYVAGRWIGGSISNFPQIKKRMEHLEKLREERESGELARKYTKKERLLIDRSITRLEMNFSGLLPLGGTLPHALFIVDTKRESIATAEARGAHIPVIGLANSDCNLKEITYPIVGNDTTKASIAFFVAEIAGAYREGMSAGVVVKGN